MKKPVCLILSAALLALTGCGSPESPAPETPAITEAPTETAAPEASPRPRTGAGSAAGKLYDLLRRRRDRRRNGGGR